MFDTHCHLTSEALKGTLPDVLAQAEAAGVHGMLSVSVDPLDAQAALDLAQAHPQVWCTAGVHPSEAALGHDPMDLHVIAKDPKCLAWGELGLDGHWPEPSQAQQHALLEAHLDAIGAWDQAGGRQLPIVVHCRKALDDLLPRLASSGIDGERFVFHCFTDGPDEARRVLTFGAAISFTGVVTYPNAPDVAAAAAIVPDDRIMIETDAPYLSPQPVRGVRPNQPAHVVHTAAFLAHQRKMEVEAFAEIADANAQRIYGMGA
ncbi:MAG: TatD family hydrolase [Phycisphaerales bacterium]|nr:TatD family hydrolase [Phycisphaerales bacterium]